MFHKTKVFSRISHIASKTERLQLRIIKQEGGQSPEIFQ